MTLTVKDLIKLVREDDYKYDAYGVCMGWLFDLADILHFERGCVPTDWEFSPGAARVPEGGYRFEEMVCYDTDTLLDFGRILQRWRRMLTHADRDY